MSYLLFSLILGSGSIAAGLIGSLTGLGGGLIIIPLLTLGFGIDIRYAIGASVISVIATSSGSAAAYVREGFTNIRIGIFLEVATTIAAAGGAALAGLFAPGVVAVVFGVVVSFSAVESLRAHHDVSGADAPSPLAVRLRLNGDYPLSGRHQSYNVTGVVPGFLLMAVAGLISGFLGIGSGVVKVIAMDRFMRLPFKVSTTTSNFMIGVTACASAGIYLGRGYVEPAIVMPVMLGVLGGSLLGARLLTRMRSSLLRKVFAAVVVVLAVEMIYNGLTGRI